MSSGLSGLEDFIFCFFFFHTTVRAIRHITVWLALKEVVADHLRSLWTSDVGRLQS